MGRIVRDLKYLARDANVPAILLAGLRRPSEDRRDRRPQLTDLAQTAALEEAADVVLLLHRPDVYEPGQHEGIMEVIVPKRRGWPPPACRGGPRRGTTGPPARCWAG
jgi:replicative DNA helicase